jgi:predicted small metal-binding protein
MMYPLLCLETGYDCSYVARGNSEGEMMQNAGRHVQEIHGMQPFDLTLETIGKLRSLIKQSWIACNLLSFLVIHNGFGRYCVLSGGQEIYFGGCTVNNLGLLLVP